VKALSVRQPWAWLIVSGQKNIENRTWRIGRNPRHGVYKSQRADFFVGLPCRIYVHASKQEDKDAYTWLHQSIGKLCRYEIHFPLIFSALIGEVDIIDCVTQSDNPWFSGPYGFVLANPKAYDTPIPCKGKLGFFEPEVTSPA
jgi:hypothetical protein